MVKTKPPKRSKKNGWTTLLIVAVVIGLSGAGYYLYGKLQPRTSNDNSVETAAIGSGDIILSATGIGTLIPAEEVSFGFRNNGRVSEVLVSLGDTVETGQVLARQNDSTLVLEYRQAEANLAALSSPAAIASAEQALQEAKLAFVSATDDLQYLIGPDMLIAEENLSQAQSELQLANAAVGRDASEVNKQRLAAAETALTKAEAALAQAKLEYEGYLLQTFIYPVRNDQGVTVSRTLFAPTDTEIETARAAYELAKANLHDAQNYLNVLKGNTTSNDGPVGSVIAITEAEINFDKAKADLNAAELLAPISGTVTSINLTVGENPGTSAVITISNLDQPYTVEAYLDESDWVKAKIGNTATVTFDLLPDNNYSGMITQVYPKLDGSSGIFMVHILVTLDVDTHLSLPPGASASVDVTGGEALGAILVPISALKEMEDGTYIVNVIRNGEPVEQEVEIGLRDILYAEVKSGLQVGDVVLTDPTINE